MSVNVWLSSAFAVVAIFSASLIYDSYRDIREVRQIQENYEIIKDIKVLLAKQYNTSPQNITRDAIIAQLPQGGNWEKVLLLDRDVSENIEDDALVNEDGEIVLDEDERLKLLALRAKLRTYGNENSITQVGDDFIIPVGEEKRNTDFDNSVIERSITIMIEILDFNRAALDNDFLNRLIEENTPFNHIYQVIRLDTETDIQFQERQETYFRDRVKQRLENSKNSKDIRLYNVVEDLL